MEVAVRDLGVEGVPFRQSGVCVNLSHTNGIVLDRSVGVLEGWGVPGEGERSGGCGSWR